jgi:tetratricopeptide (TPR) repeat protein
MDEEGSAALYEVVAIGEAMNAADNVARAQAELGYVDFLRARYDRAERWLGATVDNPTTSGMARTYLGAVASDRARYPEAIALFLEAIEVAEREGDIRIESAARTMLGRVYLLRQEFDDATESIDRGIELAERDGWLAYLPWPQSLRGEVAIARGEVETGVEILNQAFARACQLGDPCWEGFAARGLALAASASGDHDSGFAILKDARARCNRLEDPYVWLDAYILDAQCRLGIEQGHADTALWVQDMQDLTLRTGMGEFVVRALVHGAALGRSGDADAARLRSVEIVNPALHDVVLAM